MKVVGTDPVVQSLLTSKGKERPAHMPGSKQKCSPSGSQTDSEHQDWTPDKLAQAVQQANETMKVYNTSLQFKVHELSGEYFCQVINSETKDVIREVPPEWLLDMVAHFRSMVGVVVDEIV